MNWKRIVLILFPVVVIFLFESCNYTNYKYIQDQDEFFGEGKTEYSNQAPDYKIQPHDVLFVKITTMNKEINQLFSESYREEGSTVSGTNNYYMSGYTVTDSGYVFIPLVGNIQVKDSTLSNINKVVKKKVDSLLIDAIVFVKLVSFKVTFLGEVGQQGVITFYQDNLSVLDAIASVGGVTDVGDKKNILIIRKENTKYKVKRIDITDRNLLGSPDLYLMPNDLVYVEPVKQKSVRMAMQDYSFFISVITTILTSITLIATLKKN